MPPPRLATQPTVASSSTTTLEHSGTLPLTQTNGTLVLRAEPAEERHIQWAEDVVDNEGMGKKSSKVCCIYHRPHSVDESSDDESSSDDSSSSDGDSDSEVDDGRARMIGGNRRGRERRRHGHHDHNHEHSHDHDHDQKSPGDKGSKGKAKDRKPSPNAYEKQPKYVKKPASGSENRS
ncbi:hypothetical protein, variant [Verruconis gallopava]|uniref:Type 1 phosphatases regulator n=1 Tax=Verruconis gallopava TaxID=253628 RepID=A0A0D2B1P3_9PEZI|nr:uncharacterized protein PV09_03791 [Verruconis gallopava]XP_016215128.1 hypothetical protein, variant [Verruconis gallopava]KIW05258.1 hypothetical protein PV09_03791 [Verruconis gallopava]KIW05259.1 hypothetical protein, variant [Verruconis gallopava]